MLRGQTRVATDKRIRYSEKPTERIQNQKRRTCEKPCLRPTPCGCFGDTDEYRSAHEHYKYRRPSRSRSLERAQKEIPLMGDVGDVGDGGGGGGVGGCTGDRNW